MSHTDIERAERAVIAGANMAYRHPVLFQRLRDAKQQRPSLKAVVIDPRLTDGHLTHCTAASNASGP